MNNKLLIIFGILFLASSVLSIQRCSVGADEAAAYVAANCDESISNAIEEAGTLNDENMDSILEECLANYDQSPEYQASFEAFYEMAVLVFASILFGIAFCVVLVRRYLGKAKEAT